jgi:hypothetical protein
LSPVPVVRKITAPCAPNKGGNALAIALTSVAGALASTRTPPFEPRPQPLFARTNSSSIGNFFANPDSAYLTVLTEWIPGRLAVFRGVAYAYPDTEAGELVPPPPARDLRFFSYSSYKYQAPFPLIATAADFQVGL